MINVRNALVVVVVVSAFVVGVYTAEAQIGTVLDATGQQVGQTLNASLFNAQVVLHTDTLAYVVFATPTALRGTTDGLWFESSDCSGQPYIADAGAIFVPVAFLPPSQTVYVSDLTSGLRTLTAHSMLRDNNTCTPGTPSPFAAAPAVPVDDLTRFTPPFQMLLQ